MERVVGVWAVVDLRASFLSSRFGSLTKLPVCSLLNLQHVFVLLRDVHFALEELNGVLSVTAV